LSYTIPQNATGSLTFQARVEVPNCGNGASSSVTVNLAPPCPVIFSPTINGLASGSIITVACPAPLLTLTASDAPAGYGYRWSTGATTKSITMSQFADDQPVSVTFTKDYCASPACRLLVQVSPDASIPVPLASKTTDCSTPGQSKHTLQVISPSALYTYVWRANGLEQTGTNVTFQTGSTDELTVSLFARRSNGCRSTMTTMLLEACSSDNSITLQADLSPNVCQATEPVGSIALRVLNSTGRAYSFAWTVPNSAPGNLAESTNTTHVRTGLANGTYTVTVSSYGLPSRTYTYVLGNDPEWQTTNGGWSKGSYRSENRGDWLALNPNAITDQDYGMGFTDTAEPSGDLPTGLRFGFWVVGKEARVIANGSQVTSSAITGTAPLRIERDATNNLLKFFQGTNLLYQTGPNPTTPLFVAAKLNLGQLPALNTSFCVPVQRKELCAEPTLNYVRTWTPYLRVTDPAKVFALDPATQASVATAYFDGLGRPLQTVGHYASPSQQDVVQPQAYDALGRQPRQFLPYTVAPGQCSQYRPLALKDAGGVYTNSEQFKFYQAATGPANVVRDANPYADTHFEASPLDRPLRQGAPGAAWQTAGTWQPGTAPAANDRTVKTWGRPNVTADRVRRLDLTNLGPDNLTNAVFTSPANGLYAEGSLWVTITVDEHQRQVQEFKDKGGRTLLKRVETGQAAKPWADTYYVYDDFDRLAGVLPPLAAEAVAAVPNPSPVNLGFTGDDGRGLAFATVYDAKGRPIHQHTPGKGWTHTVYDRLDRPVLVQEPHGRRRDQYNHLRNDWLSTRYDALDRPVVTGQFMVGASAPGTGGRAVLQQAMNERYSLYEERLVNSFSLEGNYYTYRTLPNFGGEQIFTITYYDDYDIHRDNYPDYTPANNSLLAPAELFVNSFRHRGRVTVTKVAAPGIGEYVGRTNKPYLTGLVFYDKYGRTVQASQENITGFADVTTTRYDFAGRVRRTRLAHSRMIPQGANLVVDRDLELDPAGRPLRVYQQVTTGLGAQPRVLVAGLDYNELGQLWRKRQHSVDGGENWLQEITHRYHVRGWLAAVNDRPVDAAHLFKFSLDYEAGPTAQFNGNIAAQTWQSYLQREGLAPAAGAVRRYAYAYDALNRLTAAQYTAAGGLPGENYTTDNLAYDLNGNLYSLRRQGALALAANGLPTAYGTIDDLAYAYAADAQGRAGNQLARVTDAVAPSSAPGRADFQQRRAHWTGDPAATYLYDHSGALGFDPEKNLAARQNHLGLPEEITLANLGPGGAEYGRLGMDYTATGQKLRRTALRLAGPGGAVTATGFTEYHGPAVYQWAGTLEQAPALPASVATDEGRLVNLPNLPFGHPDTYEYHYRDHLGNLRLAYRPRTPQGQNLRLTNEPENAADEADGQGFSNFVPHRSAAHAHAGGHSLRATTASGRTGRTAQRVRLLAGQALAASAMALYEGTGGGTTQQRAADAQSAVAGRAADGGTAPPPSEVVGSGKTAAPALEMQKNGLTLAARIPDPSVPRARLVLRLFAEASGGTVLHEQEDYLDNTASWAWQQLTVGKLATVDCWAEVYVENLSSQAVWFDDLEIQTGALPVAVVVQETHYDPWGLELAGIGYLADPAKESKFTYNGKEKQDQFGLGWLDYGARHYQADIGRFTKVDRFAHKYFALTPYQYGANNPVNFIDINGDSLGVAEKYREQFNQDIKNTFGDKAESLQFNENGKLVLNGSAKEFTKGMTKEQKATFKGLMKAMQSKQTTSIVYENNHELTVGEEKRTVDIVEEFGGGVYSKTDNTIVIAPNVGAVEVMLDKFPFKNEKVEQNTTSTLFHEIGELNTTNLEYRGEVITYENNVRSILKMSPRPTDLNHSNTVRTQYKKKE
jgi:RHS repeat-associated protein